MNTKVICNKCGETVDYATYTDFVCGYGSRYDLSVFKSYICDDCLDEIVQSFKIRPQISNYIP